jgi:homoprotocatechuate degradation regulator HpaR
MPCRPGPIVRLFRVVPASTVPDIRHATGAEGPQVRDETPRRQVVVKLRSFSRSLPMSLLLAREAVMQRFRSSLQLFGITEQQWRVLRALNTVAEIEVTALARATSLLPPSLSRILRDLESRELILRKSAEDDMRKSLVAISADGARLIDAVAPYSDEIYSEITSTFGEEKLSQLQELL